jgi:hypothetical protein
MKKVPARIQIRAGSHPHWMAMMGPMIGAAPAMDVLARRHELHPVHVHLCGRRLVWVRLDDFAVDVLGIDAVPDEKNHKPQDQNND